MTDQDREDQEFLDFINEQYSGFWEHLDDVPATVMNDANTFLSSFFNQEDDYQIMGDEYAQS